MKMNMMNIAIGLLVLFLLFSIFGGRTSGYNEPCGYMNGAVVKCKGTNVGCSVKPKSNGGMGTCVHSSKAWWRKTRASVVKKTMVQ